METLKITNAHFQVLFSSEDQKKKYKQPNLTVHHNLFTVEKLGHVPT